jgi:hypothetical protein
VIGSKFFYALGYFTPENYILDGKRSEFSVAPDAKLRGVNGKPRRMQARDMAILLDKVPSDREGRMRLVASRAVEGEPLGPFKYSGTRSDDPNDVVPHERRRDLRGLHVLAAWLNHTDAKAGNSLDVLVNENGRQTIRHYLIDFGAMLGSDSDMPKDARFGHEFILPTGKDALARMFSFGFAPRQWETIEYPERKAVGRFSADAFDPETWKSNYPNPAFLSRTPEDEYWAAKLVMAFTDEEIRAVVETGKYSNRKDADYIASTLMRRRDRIGQVYFNKVLALDNFRVEAAAIRFDDLLVRYGFAPPREVNVDWYRFDNLTRALSAIPGARSVSVPAAARTARDGSYFMVRLEEAGDVQERGVRVYLRQRGGRLEVVGIERV